MIDVALFDGIEGLDLYVLKHKNHSQLLIKNNQMGQDSISQVCKYLGRIMIVS